MALTGAAKSCRIMLRYLLVQAVCPNLVTLIQKSGNVFAVK